MRFDPELGSVMQGEFMLTLLALVDVNIGLRRQEVEVEVLPNSGAMNGFTVRSAQKR
jgi:hypothetical protein